MPVAFMSGMVGKFFLQFGVTLSVAVAISYVEAITLAPARCAQMLQTTSHEARGFVGRMADRGFEALSRGYARALELALRRPWIVLATARAGPRGGRVHGDAAPAGVRALAGPEPPQRAPHDGGRRDLDETDALRAARREVPRRRGPRSSTSWPA